MKFFYVIHLYGRFRVKNIFIENTTWQQCCVMRDNAESTFNATLPHNNMEDIKVSITCEGKIGPFFSALLRKFYFR